MEGIAGNSRGKSGKTRRKVKVESKNLRRYVEGKYRQIVHECKYQCIAGREKYFNRWVGEYRDPSKI
jgi:hypothetical protein